MLIILRIWVRSKWWPADNDGQFGHVFFVRPDVSERFLGDVAGRLASRRLKCHHWRLLFCDIMTANDLFDSGKFLFYSIALPTLWRGFPHSWVFVRKLRYCSAVFGSARFLSRHVHCRFSGRKPYTRFVIYVFYHWK